MATHVWRGDAPAVAQVDTVEITAYDSATTYTLTINGKDVSVVGDTDATTTATNLAAAWNASAIEEFKEVTASSDAAVITLTADTAGVPFTCTSSVSGGTGTIGAVSASTANAGPNVWAAQNFDSGTLPADGDDVIFENSTVDCLYNLDQSAVTLATLRRRQSYTGRIGLPRTNASGYVEYRETYLKIGTTNVYLGEGDGNGSGRSKLDLGSAQTAIEVWNAAFSRAETGIPCDLLLGTHASNTIHVYKGDVGLAFFGGEVATFATINVGYRESRVSDSQVVCREGVTLTTVNCDGGETELNGAVTTIDVTDGEVTVRGTGTLGTLKLDAGTCYYESSGTLDTVRISGGAALDLSRNQQARTINNCTIYQGGALRDPAKTATFTNGIDLDHCGLGDVSLDLGEHQTLTPSAI